MLFSPFLVLGGQKAEKTDELFPFEIVLLVFTAKGAGVAL
jgi:hypothetical protein